MSSILVILTYRAAYPLLLVAETLEMRCILEMMFVSWTGLMTELRMDKESLANRSCDTKSKLIITNRQFGTTMGHEMAME